LKAISMSCSGKASLDTQSDAGALRPCHGVGVFTHLARDRKRCIDIEDIECLFYHTWSRVAPKRARSFAAVA
jgi:hypothetical protein